MSCCIKGIARKIIGIVSTCVIVCAVIAAVVVYKKENNQAWIDLVKNNVAFIFILVAMGCAVLSGIVGFLLCCIHLKCIYFVYLVLIIIVIIIEIIAIVFAFTNKNKILNGIHDNWNQTALLPARQKVEKQYQCCGFYNETDDKTIDGTNCGSEKPLGVCYTQIKKEVDKNIKNLKIAAIVMAAVELVLLICAIYLTCA